MSMSPYYRRHQLYMQAQYRAGCFEIVLVEVMLITVDHSIFNTGSPYNVAAGTTADLSAVAEHYHKKNQAIEEARVARMKDGKVVSLYD